MFARKRRSVRGFATGFLTLVLIAAGLWCFNVPISKASAQEKLQTASTKPFFIENKGQTFPEFKYYYKGDSHSAYFAKDKIVFQSLYPAENGKVREVIYDQVFDGINPDPKIVGFNPLETKISYFLGNNQKSDLRFRAKNRKSGVF